MGQFIELTDFYKRGPVTIRTSEINAVWLREPSIGQVCTSVLVGATVFDVTEPYDDVVALIPKTFNVRVGEIGGPLPPLDKIRPRG